VPKRKAGKEDTSPKRCGWEESRRNGEEHAIWFVYAEVLLSTAYLMRQKVTVREAVKEKQMATLR
jgi:hypothetical protein